MSRHVSPEAVGSPPRKPLTRAERNIRWCEEHLCLPEGSHIGRKLVLPAFMREDFKAIYDMPEPGGRSFRGVERTARARNAPFCS
jgi:hypothetical protein